MPAPIPAVVPAYRPEHCSHRARGASAALVPGSLSLPRFSQCGPQPLNFSLRGPRTINRHCLARRLFTGRQGRGTRGISVHPARSSVRCEALTRPHGSCHSPGEKREGLGSGPRT